MFSRFGIALLYGSHITPNPFDFAHHPGVFSCRRRGGLRATPDPAAHRRMALQHKRPAGPLLPGKVLLTPRRHRGLLAAHPRHAELSGPVACGRFDAGERRLADARMDAATAAAVADAYAVHGLPDEFGEECAERGE